MGFLYYFDNPGSTGYDFVIVAGSTEEARLMAKQSATSAVDPEQLPAVLRDIERGMIGCHYTPKALAIFTECDPALSLECRERHDYLEDCETVLQELDALLSKAPAHSLAATARVLIQSQLGKVPS